MDGEVTALEAKLSKVRQVKARMMSVLLTGKIRLVGSGSGMDGEVTALEGKLSKARQVNAGMMSVLLTGRIRLVES